MKEKVPVSTRLAAVLTVITSSFMSVPVTKNLTMVFPESYPMVIFTMVFLATLWATLNITVARGLKAAGNRTLELNASRIVTRGLLGGISGTVIFVITTYLAVSEAWQLWLPVIITTVIYLASLPLLLKKVW